LLDFGDGVTGEFIAPGDTFPYIYSVPGTYTPRLSVFDTDLNLSDTKTGSPITVTAPPVADGPGVFDVVRTAMPTGVATKTLLFNLRDNAPALVLMWLTKATAVDSEVDGAMLSYGAATPSKQWCFTLNSRDNQATSNTERYATQNACIQALDAGVIVGSARVGSFAANQLVLDVTDGFPAGYLLTAAAFGGAQYAAHADAFHLDVQNSVTTLLPGFRPELYFFGGGSQVWETLEDNADFALGMADPTNQYAFTWRDTDAMDTTRVRASMSSGGRAIRNPNNTATAGFSDYSAGKLTVYTNDIQRQFAYAALDAPLETQIAVKQFATPTATGSQSYDVGFQPTGAIMLFSNLTMLNAHYAEPMSEGFSIVAADVYATYGLAIASDHAAGTSNSRSLATDSIKVIDGTGTVVLAGTLTFDADGFDINWTTVATSLPRYFMVTAVAAAPSITGPIPEFTASTTAPIDGVVQFTDLSNPNGSAITDWQWSFGDGETSIEQHPEHTYIEPGTYTVSLAVGNANGAEARFKTDYITFTIFDEWLSTYWPRTVTNTSTNTLYGNNEAHEYYGYVEHELDLDGLEIDAAPEDLTTPSARPGKARIVLDAANGRLNVIMPDGTIEYIGLD
jgi:PKD repeat protein